MTVRAARRAFVALAFASAAVLVAPRAAAQDPRTTDAQAAARAWLAYTDQLDAADSHRTAGRRFQDAIPADKWAQALKAVRGPLGNVEQRTLAGSRFAVSFEGLPTGEYAQLTFRTAWTSKPDGYEHLTLEKVDGRWKVIGYVVQ